MDLPPNLGAKTVSDYVPFDASASAMQDVFSGFDETFNVEVSRLGSNKYLGYTWTVTFITPRGSLSMMNISTLGNGIISSLPSIINKSFRFKFRNS
jgi:hypothetical protein